MRERERKIYYISYTRSERCDEKSRKKLQSTLFRERELLALLGKMKYKIIEMMTKTMNRN